MTDIASGPPLTAESVTRRFGARSVVANASLTLKPGTLTALLGPSGAGKSTLLRILAGLEPLDEGVVRLGHKPLSEPGRIVPAEKRRTGLIFQDYALFPHLTALGNVLFGLNHLSRVEAERQAHAWLDRMALSSRGAAYPHQLSGGEQQRVAIARALAPDPDVILMDEPFSGLDPALEAEVRQAALRALADAGKPALLVTHDPVAAMAMADRLAIMREGRILQAGTAEEVYRNPVDLGAASALAPIQTLAPPACPHSLLEDLEIPDEPVLLGFRPDWVLIDPSAATPAQVVSSVFQGSLRQITVEVQGTTPAPLRLTLVQPAGDPTPSAGDTIRIRLQPHGRFIFPLSE